MRNIIITLCLLALVGSTAYAEEFPLKRIVEDDFNIPFTIKTSAINEFDRHISGREPLYKDIVSPHLFTLSNNTTYMVFELNGGVSLVMYLSMSNDTGLVDLLWSKDVGHQNRKFAKKFH